MRILAVDLDGTLHSGDIAWHGIWLLLRKRPWEIFRLLLWAAKGRLRLKNEVARRCGLNIADLEWNPEVISFLADEAAKGRPIALATGAASLHAEQAASHLAKEHGISCIAVIACSETENMVGEQKAAALAAMAGEDGFDYIGDSAHQDPPIFAVAKVCHLVNPGESLLRYQSEESKVFHTRLGFTSRLRRRLLDLVQHQSAKKS